jgi:hypothetical protein
MDESTRAIILLVLIMLLLIALAFLGSTFLMRRAIKAVIKMFRDKEAYTPETAKTEEELGFKRRSFIQFKAMRDYKPTALQFLLRSNIVQMTDEGKFYISEEALSQTRLGQQQQRT